MENADLTTGTFPPNSTMSLHEIPTEVSISLLVFGIPIGLVLVVLNPLMWIVLKKSDEGTFRKSTTAWLVSMSICDFTAGLILLLNLSFLAMPDGGFGGVISSSSGYLCRLWASLQTMPLMGDIIHLTAISGERNQTISHPARQPRPETMKLLALGVWGLTLALFALVFAFPATEPNSGYCDIADLPFLYFIIVVFVVVILGSVVVCSYFLFNIKGTLKVHQRKIQVTNTITYDNLMDDTAVAKLFFVIYVLTIVLWLPFIVSVVVSYVKGGGIDSAVRFVFLFGNLAYLKVPMVICGNERFRTKFVDTFKRKPESFIRTR